MIEIREKPLKVENAVLIGIQYPESERNSIEELLDELEELVGTLDIKVKEKMVVKIAKPYSRFLTGSGKMQEIVDLCKKNNYDVVIFDETLRPSQQRNWEKESELCVIDRREIILDIFAERATTREAVLQTSLARAKYDLPRLTRAWTHLSRQRGGAMLRGEGEAQLEADRRMVRKRIQQLQAELEKVRKHRATQRKQRRKRPVPNAALVGYTNVGKSSLLNYLSDAEVLVDDRLFATLDPTTKKISLPNNQELLLTDTVGFIRKLPHNLIEAFKATLEEALLADFLVHVVDVNLVDVEEYISTTMDVLEELNAHKKKMIMVFNKTDLLEDKNILHKLSFQYKGAVFVSAQTGEGVDELLNKFCKVLEEELAPVKLKIPFNRYDMIALLHRTSDIQSETYEDKDIEIEACIPEFVRKDIAAFICNEGTD